MSTVTINSQLIERPTAYANISSSAYVLGQAIIANAANPIGGGAGSTVVVPVVFSPSNLPADLNYTIQLTANQACAISWSAKAISGFTVTLTPLSGSLTLAAGTFDAVVTWIAG